MPPPNTPLPATRFPNRTRLQRHFQALPEEIKPHFEHFEGLITSDFPLEVCLAYVFYMVELAHRDTLYCGVVKLHDVHAAMTRRIIQSQHLTRDNFQMLFQSLFGQPVRQSALQRIRAAEAIRDKVMHGSEPTPAMMRTAISQVLDYARDYDDFVFSLGMFHPFGDLRGFHGRGERLSTATTRLVLKGIGFSVA